VLLAFSQALRRLVMTGKFRERHDTDCTRKKTELMRLFPLNSRSLLNEIQNYGHWETFFDDIGDSNVSAHKTSLLGLLTNMFTIGSIVSMFIM
jgi:hypothetical protein